MKKIKQKQKQNKTITKKKERKETYIEEKEEIKCPQGFPLEQIRPQLSLGLHEASPDFF